MSGSDPLELPLTDAVPERADAARNRRRVLVAAERLFAERGAECVSMDEVATAAGVGKGTVFRRFGDRASLFRAVLSEREREFQEAFIRGPAPLGPGAPPGERIVAFGRGLLDLIAGRPELLALAEGGAPGGRYRTAVYAAYRAHLTFLVRAAAPQLDAEHAADALLAPLRADLVLHQRADRGMDLERIADGWEALARGLLRCSYRPPSAA